MQWQQVSPSEAPPPELLLDTKVPHRSPVKRRFGEMITDGGGGDGAVRATIITPSPTSSFASTSIPLFRLFLHINIETFNKMASAKVYVGTLVFTREESQARCIASWFQVIGS